MTSRRLPTFVTRLWVAGWLVFTGVFLTGNALGAETQTRGSNAKVSFDWAVYPPDAECPGEPELKQAVEHILDRPVFAPATQAERTLRGRVGKNEGGRGWQVDLEMFDAAGTRIGVRQIRSPGAECRSLIGPLPLVIALLVDVKKPVVTVRVRVPPPKKAEPPPALGSTPTRRRWTSTNEVSAALSFGLLPKVALGPSIDLALGLPRGPLLGIGLTVFPEVSDIRDGRGGSFSAWYGGPSLCVPLVTGPRLGGGLCAGARFGTIRAVGRGLENVSRPQDFHTQLQARGKLSVRLGGPLHLQAAVGAGVPVIRRRYFFTEGGAQEEVHQLSPVLLLGQIGVAAHFSQ